MTFILFGFILLCINNLKIAKPNEFYTDYLSLEKSNSIKGIFIITVFLSHIAGYLTLDRPFDLGFNLYRAYHSQLIVTYFLFCSGYGIMEAIKTRGWKYTSTIPKKRVGKVLLHFDLAVILFLITNFIIHRSVDIKTFILSLTGWSSIGNSNWYIFAILTTYLATFVGFCIFKKNKWCGAIFTSILCIVIIFCLWKVGRPNYYYNTIVCYVLGIWFSLFKEKIDAFVMKNDITYLLTGCILFALYYFVFRRRFEGLPWYSAWAVVFTVLILLLTMKFSFYNGFIQFLGKHIFSIYILQRIPMWILSEYGYTKIPYTYTIACFLATILIALMFDYFVSKIDLLVFNRKGHNI